MSSLRQFRFKKESLKNGTDPETASSEYIREYPIPIQRANS